MNDEEFKIFLCYLLEECFGQADLDVILKKILEQLVEDYKEK